MYLSTAIVLQCLAVKALADFSIQGPDYTLRANPLVNASRVTDDLYSHCKYNHEGLVSEGKECVGEAVKIMVAFLSNAGSTHQGGDKAVVLLNKIGVGNEVLQPTAIGSSTTSVASSTASLGSPRFKPKRDAGKARELLENFNTKLLRRSGGREDIRAVGLDHSTAQSNDGLVVRTNVRSGDAALYVHSNASHATAAFKKDPPLPNGKRTINYDQGVEFQGMQGFKLMIRWIDEGFGLDEIESALLQFVTQSLKSDPQSVPTYMVSDAWTFAVCGKTDGHTNDQMKLQGKLVSLDENAGDDFEDNEWIDCDVYKEVR